MFANKAHKLRSHTHWLCVVECNNACAQRSDGFVAFWCMDLRFLSTLCCRRQQIAFATKYANRSCGKPSYILHTWRAAIDSRWVEFSWKNAVLHIRQIEQVKEINGERWEPRIFSLVWPPLVSSFQHSLAYSGTTNRFKKEFFVRKSILTISETKADSYNIYLFKK